REEGEEAVETCMPFIFCFDCNNINDFLHSMHLDPVDKIMIANIITFQTDILYIKINYFLNHKIAHVMIPFFLLTISLLICHHAEGIGRDHFHENEMSVGKRYRTNKHDITRHVQTVIVEQDIQIFNIKEIAQTKFLYKIAKDFAHTPILENMFYTLGQTEHKDKLGKPKIDWDIDTIIPLPIKESLNENALIMVQQ
ncbi:hypothetical protein ACJX0J_033989, partial [Zea mays]